MDAKIVILDSTNPYLNIAREYEYYNNISEDEVIFLLWQNDSCVVMGRNQNIYSELDLEYIEENSISPVRRFTGGGCVYHDLGNLNFTFISKQKNKDLDLWMRIILNALEKQSIHAQIKGRNDLTVDDKKFSGMAWLEDEDKYLIHGTLMIDLDLSILSKCLTPDISKFIGKGIKSVKSRVTNLKKLNPNLTVEKMRDSLVQAFKEAYQNSTIIEHDVLANELNTFKMLMDESWIFGKREKAQIERSFMVDGRPLNFDIFINNGIIKMVDIYCDSLEINKVEKIKINLLDKKYKDLHIEEIINSIWT